MEEEEEEEEEEDLGLHRVRLLQLFAVAAVVVQKGQQQH